MTAPRRLKAASQTAVGGASAAMVSQGVVAGSSLLLQVLALLELDLKGLGTYSILSAGLLVTATAIHTGWVGDPIILLDRRDDRVRRALVAASGISVILSFLFGLLGAAIFTSLDFRSCALFGIAVVVWLVEESGRRLLMARLEFVKLAVNDVAYAVAAIGVAGSVTIWSRLTMNWLVFAMICGSVAAIIAAFFQIPRDELTVPTRGSIAFRELYDVSLWRSGQLMMRPLGMLLVRAAIQLFVSTATLGLFEAGRLLTAPILTAANGFGGFSLAFFTRKRDEGELTMSLPTKFSLASAAVAALYIPVAFLLQGPFEKFTDTDSMPKMLVLAWCIYAVAYAANIPSVNALTSLLYSQQVFWGRMIDSVLILILSVIIVKIDGVRFLPLAMTVGILVGTAVPLVNLGRQGKLTPEATKAFQKPTPKVRASRSPKG